MMDLNSIAAAYQGVKLVRDSLKTVENLSTELTAKIAISEAFQRVTDLQDALFSAQQHMTSQETRIRELATKLEEVENWQAQAANYSMLQTAGGAVLWKSDVPIPHYACPVCHSRKSISVLQTHSYSDGTWTCIPCNANFSVRQPTPISANFASEFSDR